MVCPVDCHSCQKHKIPLWRPGGRETLTVGVALILFLVSLADWAGAETDPVRLTGLQDAWFVGSQMAVLADPDASLTIAQVSHPDRGGWVLAGKKSVLNLGANDSAFWLRITLENLTARKDWLLESNFQQLDFLRLYIPDDRGGFREYQSGDQVPISKRAIKTRNILFPLRLEPGSRVTLYLWARSIGRINVTPVIRTPENSDRKDFLESLWLGGFFLVILLMIALNTYLLFRHRLLGHLFYIGYVFFSGLFLFSLNGMGFWLFWPEQPFWNNFILLYTPPLVYLSGLFFLKHFLETRSLTPLTHHLVTVLQALWVVLLFAPLIIHGSLALNLMNYLGLFSAIVAAVTALRIWRRGFPPARLFFLAEIFPYLGLTMTVLSSIPAFPYLGYPYSLQFTVGVGVILFSFGLAERAALFREMRTRRWAASLARLRDGETGGGVAQAENFFRPDQQGFWRRSENLAVLISGLKEEPPGEGNNLSIRTFGRLEVIKNGKSLKLSQRGEPKHIALLKILITHSNRETSDVLLSEMLWPDLEGDRVQGAFRTTLYRLRQMLGNENILRSPEGVSINESFCLVDKYIFERKARQILSADEPARPPETERLEELVSLYRGDFFPGDETPLILAERERLGDLYSRVVLLLGRQYQTSGKIRQALQLYQQGMRRNERAEPICRAAMALSLEIQDFAIGISIYRHLEAVLLERDGRQPEPETTALYQSLLDSGKTKTA